MGVSYGYARVSSEGQRAALTWQNRLLVAKGCQRLMSDVGSGTTTRGRSGLSSLIGSVKPGDEIVVRDYSRFTRSVSDGERLLRNLKDHGVRVRSIFGAESGIDTLTDEGLSDCIKRIGMYQEEIRIKKASQSVGILSAKGMTPVSSALAHLSEAERDVGCTCWMLLMNMAKAGDPLITDLNLLSEQLPEILLTVEKTVESVIGIELASIAKAFDGYKEDR